MVQGFIQGLRALTRNRGLPVLLLAVNLVFAGLLTAPLSLSLERHLEHRESARRMMYGFDVPFWEHWAEEQSGAGAAFSPAILGVGFVFRNLDLLLRGHLPLRLFDHGLRGVSDPLPPIILGVAAAYGLMQVFLTGGLLAVLRRPRGGWKLRGLLHGAGFYFGRLSRLALLTLGLYGLVFVVHAPLARWAEVQARAAVSENSAMVWLFGRQFLLLMALLGVFLVAAYAKVILVVEERTSALLALVSSFGFCLRRPATIVGHFALVGLAGGLLLWAWLGFDTALVTTGYKTQLVSFAAAQAFMLGRIGLRLTLLGGQVAVYQQEA